MVKFPFYAIVGRLTNNIYLGSIHTNLTAFSQVSRLTTNMHIITIEEIAKP